MEELYSLEKVEKFQWPSITGGLPAERVSILERHVVGEKILDAGCGGGAYVDFLAQKGLEVTGIDKHEHFVQSAKSKGMLGNFVQGDLTCLPFSNKSFDCTYCFDVLEHIDDYAAIQELTRVTSKRLIISVPREDDTLNKFNLTFLHYQDLTHLRYYDVKSLKNLISSINCESVLILPEIAVPIKELARDMIKLAPENITIKGLRTLIKIRMLNLVFKQVLAGNMPNLNSIYRESYNSFFEKLLDQASCSDIYTNLVAIIDLRP